MNNLNIRTMVRGAYDLQKLRIMIGNRLVANWKAKLGQAPSSPESELGAEEKTLIDKLRLHYKKITDGVTGEIPTQKKFKGDELISSYTELCLLNQYFEMEAREAKHFRQLEKALEEFPIYTEFLKEVRGCGAAMSGVIISEIDIHKAKYASSIWQYAGLGIGPDGKGMSRRKEHLVEQTYVDKQGVEQTKLGVTFKPFLKTKLIGVLATSFLRSKSPYAEAYYNYKNRLKNRPDCAELSDGHIHNRAMRFMVKLFLIDLYAKWRELEGLEVHPPYHEAKLGIFHGK